MTKVSSGTVNSKASAAVDMKDVGVNHLRKQWNHHQKLGGF